MKIKKIRKTITHGLIIVSFFMTTLQSSLVSGICTVMLMAQLITGTLAGTHKEIRKIPLISVTPKVNPPPPLKK